MSKRKWRWCVLRNDDRVEVFLSSKKPIQSKDYFRVWKGGSSFSVFDMCRKEFSAVTRLKLKPNQPVKVEFSARIVE